VTFRNHARQILSRAALDSDVFQGKTLYDADAIKDALKGESSNVYLKTILPLALKRISQYHQEAIAKRYVDGEYAQNKQEENAQMRAISSLTREVNVLYITAEVEGIGSSSVVFPDTIHPKGDHSDPTGNIALMLMDQPPDFVDEYLYESPWEQVCQGAWSEPVLDIGPEDGDTLRLTAEEAVLFRRVPGLLELFVEHKQKDWGNE